MIAPTRGWSAAGSLHGTAQHGTERQHGATWNVARRGSTAKHGAEAEQEQRPGGHGAPRLSGGGVRLGGSSCTRWTLRPMATSVPRLRVHMHIGVPDAPPLVLTVSLPLPHVEWCGAWCWRPVCLLQITAAHTNDNVWGHWLGLLGQAEYNCVAGRGAFLLIPSCSPRPILNQFMGDRAAPLHAASLTSLATHATHFVPRYRPAHTLPARRACSTNEGRRGGPRHEEVGEDASRAGHQAQSATKMISEEARTNQAMPALLPSCSLRHAARPADALR